MNLGRVLATLVAMSGSKSAFEIPRGVELTTRKSGSAQWIYILNHTGSPQTITVPGHFKSVFGGGLIESKTTIDPYGVLVLQPS